MSTFRTTTAVGGIDAAAVLNALLAHLTEHEFESKRQDAGWLLDYEGAEILFMAQGDTLRVEIVAPTHELLFDARMMAHHHLAEFAACARDSIQWDGDQPAFERPPAFRILTVISTHDITPHLRRLRFRADNLARYANDENLHCKLLIPQPGVTQPEWPTLGGDGLPSLPTGEKRLDMRTYTIRRLDPQAGWMEIDFVLHEDAGPGAGWAARAQPGDQVGVTGPGGRTARPAAWMLLAADETGLPAIARIAETLPPDTQGEIIIEVQNATDELPLTKPDGMTLRWLHRGDRVPGQSPLLQDAVLASHIPVEGDRFVWVAAEFATAQTVRKWLRDTVGMSGKDQLVVAYWRFGMDETSMKSGGRAATGKQSEKAGE